MARRILLMSSERSGSNLLRSMLSAHSDVHGPPAIHFTHGFDHIFRLGDLTEDANFRQLAEDVREMAASHPMGWEGIGLSVDDLVARAPHRSLWGLVDVLLMERAERAGATRWVCKDNHLFDHAFAISHALDDVAAVYLVRDGRDVVCSMLDAPLHPKHAYVAGVEWAREQRRALRVHQQLLADGRSVMVRYEQLVAEPETELRRVCGVLGLAFEPGMLEAHQRKENKRLAGQSSYWKNLGKAVSNRSVSRYERDLDAATLRTLESVTRDVLEALGYDPVTAYQPPPGGLRASWFRNLSRIRQKRTAARGGDHIAKRQDVLHRQRRRPVTPWIDPEATQG